MVDPTLIRLQAPLLIQGLPLCRGIPRSLVLVRKKTQHIHRITATAVSFPSFAQAHRTGLGSITTVVNRDQHSRRMYHVAHRLMYQRAQQGNHHTARQSIAEHWQHQSNIINTRNIWLACVVADPLGSIGTRHCQPKRTNSVRLGAVRRRPTNNVLGKSYQN